MSLYYNWRTLDGYPAKVYNVIGGRGIGKTFGRVYIAIKDFILKRKQFIYVVETLEMVKVLSQNRGDKFFRAIIDYLSEQAQTSKRKARLLAQLQGEVSEGDVFNKIRGGTISINGETAGYIVALNDFANLKRNNFGNIGDVIIDEYIPEKQDIRTLDNPRKLVSIVQSIARLKDIRIYMLTNSVRLSDSILVRLGLHTMKLGEIRKIKDKYGLFMVAHFVDPNEYKELELKKDASVAGRLAELLGESNLDKNTFIDTIDSKLLIPRNRKGSHLFCCLHGSDLSIRINITKDHTDYYIMEDYGENTRKRVCLDKADTQPYVNYIPTYKDLFLTKLQGGHIYFENSLIYEKFKKIMKLFDK